MKFLFRNFRIDPPLILSALFLFFLFHLVPIIFRFQVHQTLFILSLLEVLTEIVLGLLVAIASCIILARTRICTLIFLFLGFYYLYFIYKFKIQINLSTLSLLYHAELQEVLNFLSVSLLATILFATFTSYKLLEYFRLFEVKVDPKKLFISIVFFLSVIFIDPDFMVKYYPIDLLHNNIRYIIAKEHTKPTQNFNAEISDLHQGKNLKVIFVIGESLRPDHLGLNQYHRNTTPLLDNIHGLINVGNYDSCGILTRDAVPCLLNSQKSKYSLIEIFKKTGYKTYWLGVQGSYSVIDRPFTSISEHVDQRIMLSSDLTLTPSYDLDSLPFLKNILDKDERSFIIIHSFGSHYHYEDRYQREFEIFSPICKKSLWFTGLDSCTHQEIINSYDNTIVMTDFFLHQIIQLLNKSSSPAMMYFTSDHGELLGEYNGLYLHGFHDSPEQRSVPLLIYYNDPTLLPKHLESSRLKDYHNIFPTIIGCSGINFEGLENDANLCYSADHH